MRSVPVGVGMAALAFACYVASGGSLAVAEDKPNDPQSGEAKPADGKPADPAPARAPSSTAVVLKVRGLVDKPLSLSAEDLARMPRQTVEAQGHDGKAARFEGVSLTEILKAAGAPLGDKLRGPQLSKFLLVRAADGYRAVFALPELDPAFTDTIVLLADRRDGQPLATDEGPLRLVVAKEKRQARWVRQVQVLEVMQPNP